MIGSTLKAVALAALVTVGGGAAMTMPAAATSISYELYVDGPNGGFRVGKNRWAHEREFRRHPYRNVCAPRRAVRKASHMGVRGARVVRFDPRRVVVGGRAYGAPIRVIFANQRSCPVIGYR